VKAALTKVSLGEVDAAPRQRRIGGRLPLVLLLPALLGLAFLLVPLIGLLAQAP
jgi:hypothetical protein